MKKILKKSFLFSLGLLVFATSNSLADTNVSRISGSDRYETSIEISKKFSKATYVIIASGEKYPDAVMGGSLATQTTSPILLVREKSISSSVLSEISRLYPKKIFVLGGIKSVSSNIVSEIRKITDSPIERIYGNDRYETAEKINSLRMNLTGLTDEDWEGITRYYMIGVPSNNFYDALYTAPYVGLITSEDGWIMTTHFVHPVIDFENDINDETEIGTIVGDVTEKNRYEDRLFPYMIKGKNRYETSVKIAQKYSDKKILGLDFDTVVITSGENYPDGLSSSGITALYKIPILLSPKNRVDTSVKKFIQENNIKNIIIVGGEKSVSKEVENELKRL